MQRRRFLTVIGMLIGLAPIVVRADDPLERRFADVVQPFLKDLPGLPRREEEGGEARPERLFVAPGGGQESPGLGPGAGAARGGGDAAREGAAAALGARAPGGHRMDRGRARARSPAAMRAIRGRCWRGG